MEEGVLLRESDLLRVYNILKAYEDALYFRDVTTLFLTAGAASMDPGVIEKYVSGYTECTHEVTRYMNLMEGIDNDSKQYLMKHLNSGVQMVSGTKNVLRATTIPSEATLSPTADAACIKRVVTSPVVEALHAQAPSSPVADPYNCHKQISHHTSLSVEALERLSLLPNPNQQDSSMSQCLSYTHVVTDGLTPIDIKPRVNDSVVTTIVSPKDFESTDSGICDRVDDCSNSSMSSSSDQERDSRIYCSDQYTDKTDVNNNDLPISDISEDDEFVWRPW